MCSASRDQLWFFNQGLCRRGHPEQGARGRSVRVLAVQLQTDASANTFDCTIHDRIIHHSLTAADCVGLNMRLALQGDDLCSGDFICCFFELSGGDWNKRVAF